MVLPEAEGGEAFRGFGLDGYVVDRGQAWAGVGPVNQAADIVCRPLEDGFEPDGRGGPATGGLHGAVAGGWADGGCVRTVTIRPAVGLVPGRVLYVISLVA